MARGGRRARRAQHRWVRGGIEVPIGRIVSASFSPLNNGNIEMEVVFTATEAAMRAQTYFLGQCVRLTKAVRLG